MAAKLAASGVERPLFEADLLFVWALGCERFHLLAHPDRILTADETDRIAGGLRRRMAGEPMAYILGHAAFCDFDLHVGPGCLIPRPETELLVETALSLWQEGPFLDWGTGSGAVAVALLRARPESEGFAVEAEPSALKWAWRNLKEQVLLRRCRLIHEERLEELPPSVGSLGLIVSNPPYIPTGDLPGLMRDVAFYEPERALDGGGDGLAAYRCLLPWAAGKLRPGGFVVVEHGGAEQHVSLLDMAIPGLEFVASRKDLSGTPRILAWRRFLVGAKMFGNDHSGKILCDPRREKEVEKRELVIVGAGPAGLTAAIYGRRAGLDVLVLEKGLPGGQINITDEIENWPGVPHSTGADLAKAFKEHAAKFEPEFRDVAVGSLQVRQGVKVVATEKGSIEADAVIIATGASFRRLGCPGEAELIGRGVSYCAVCDAAFFQDAEVAVIGGGNTAVEEALYLTRFASKVYIVHRRDTFRADKVPVERALASEKIVPVFNSVVEKINGDEMVEGLTLKNVRTGETSELPVEGVFVFVGTEPNVSFLEDGQLRRSRGGWIITDEKMETSEEGVFAAGDVRDKALRQVVTAAADGAVAAMSAYAVVTDQHYLHDLLFKPNEAVALFTSSIDEKQVRLAAEVEAWAGERGRSVVLVDGYRFRRMSEKLGVEAMPSALLLRKGEVVQRLSLVAPGDLEPLFDFS